MVNSFIEGEGGIGWRWLLTTRGAVRVISQVIMKREWSWFACGEQLQRFLICVNGERWGRRQVDADDGAQGMVASTDSLSARREREVEVAGAGVLFMFFRRWSWSLDLHVASTLAPQSMPLRHLQRFLVCVNDKWWDRRRARDRRSNAEGGGWRRLIKRKTQTRWRWPAQHTLIECKMQMRVGSGSDTPSPNARRKQGRRTSLLHPHRSRIGVSSQSPTVPALTNARSHVKIHPSYEHSGLRWSVASSCWLLTVVMGSLNTMAGWDVSSRMVFVLMGSHTGCGWSWRDDGMRKTTSPSEQPISQSLRKGRRCAVAFVRRLRPLGNSQKPRRVSEVVLAARHLPTSASRCTYIQHHISSTVNSINK